MAWEIKGLNSATPRATTPRAHDPTVEASSGSTGSLKPSRIDQIIFTDAAVSLQRLDGLLRESPVEDAARIGTLREQIAGGSYKIDDFRTADKLTALEFLLNQVNANDGFQTSA